MIFDLFRLDGKVALVTGATRGIGLGIVEALSDAGAHVILSSKVPKPDVVARFKDAGRKVDYLQGDVQDPAVPAQLIAEAVKLGGGKLDILVNNAGVAQHGETHSFPEEQYRRLMDINLDSVFRACQAALGPMRVQKSGVILNIGSISGLISNIPQPQAAYNASKAAVHMLTKSLASDYADDGIRVNAIAPGTVDSPSLHERWHATGDFEAAKKAFIARQPIGRIAKPEEVADLAVYLAGATYTTGQVHIIDGGWTA